MFENIKTGWKIGLTTTRFVWENKKLMVFPLLSLACLGIVTILLGIVGNRIGSTWAFWLSAIPLFYFSAIFFSIFFSVAAINMIHNYFQGVTNPSFLDSIKISIHRTGCIFVWTLISGTVGLICSIINVIEEKIHLPILSWILEATWGILTLFVVPVICFNPTLNPLSLIKESLSVFKKAFGEPNTALKIVGAGLFYLTVMLPIFLLLYVGSQIPNPTISSTIIGFCIIVGVLIYYFKIVADDVLSTTLYHFSLTGNFPPEMDPELLAKAIRKTKSSFQTIHRIKP